MKEMDDKVSNFCSNHYYLQPSDSWDIENIAFSYEDCRMKDCGEKKQFSPSFSVGDPKSSAKNDDVVNGDKGTCGSDPK